MRFTLIILLINIFPFISLYSQTSQKAPLNWFIQQRLKPSIINMALSDRHTGWGGKMDRNITRDKVSRYVNGKWNVVNDFPDAFMRAHVLDIDSSGNPWICAYNPDYETTFKRLSLYTNLNDKWIKYIAEPGIWPQCIRVVSETETWLGGNSCLFLHFKNNQFSIKKPVLSPEKWGLTKEETDIISQNILRSAIYDIRMINAEIGWAVGNMGMLFKYENGNWYYQKTPEHLHNITLKALDITENKIIWAAGENGTIARYDSEQKTWKIFTSPTKVFLNSIDMLSSKEGYCVGQRGTILYYYNDIWTRIKCPVVN